jgi:uncharacterized membrane protein
LIENILHILFVSNLNKIIKDMKKNMGITDRVIRVIIAVIIVLLYFTKVITGTLGIVLIALAGIFVLTSFISFCPIYAPFGLSTCKVKEK